MALTNTLPIDKHPESLFLTTSEGLPVWPAKTVREQLALINLVEIFSAKVELIRGHTRRTEIELEEVVIALGDGVAESASLYAHLTQRRFCSAIDLDELTRIENLAIIVTTPRWLTSELMEILYLPKAEYAPGIICAATSESLREQVLVRSAAVFLDQSAEIIQTSIFPTLPLSKLTTSGVEILGGQADPSDIQSALSRKSNGVLTVVSHSDGIDAFLGSDLILCPLNRRAEEVNESISPRCWITGMCHRRGTSVSDALNSGFLIPPENISARILIWNVCLGLLPPDGIIDPAWGVGPRLLCSSTIGAIVTTWEIVLNSPDHMNVLSQDLARGIPVGRALAQFNNSLASRQKGLRLCLLGDPQLSLSAGAATYQPASTDDSTIEVDTKPSTASPVISSVKPILADAGLQEIMFLRACISEGLSSTSEDLLPFALKALQAIQNYESTAWKGIPVEGRLDAPGSCMRHSVLKYIFRRGKLNDWSSFILEYEASVSRKKCFTCNRLTNTLITRLRLPGVSNRRISICPCCGVIEDAPIGFDVTFSMNNSSVQLFGDVPHTQWTAGLLLTSSLPSDNIGVEWPSTSEGKPVEKLNLPQSLPLGPLRLWLVILWKANYAAISAPLQKITPRDAKSAGRC